MHGVVTAYLKSPWNQQFYNTTMIFASVAGVLIAFFACRKFCPIIPGSLARLFNSSV